MRYFISPKCFTQKEPRKDKGFVTFSNQVNVVYMNTTFCILFTVHTYNTYTQFRLEIGTRQTSLLQKRLCTHFIAHSQNIIIRVLSDDNEADDIVSGETSLQQYNW